MTVEQLKQKISEYSDHSVVMCGFEGLTFYKKMENGKYSFIGVIDFENEKKRNQQLLSDTNHTSPSYTG